MPTYEYVCKDCKKTFILIATIAEHEKGSKPAWPYCASKNVEQNYSAVNVISLKKS